MKTQTFTFRDLSERAQVILGILLDGKVHPKEGLDSQTGGDASPYVKELEAKGLTVEMVDVFTIQAPEARRTYRIIWPKDEGGL